jgi:hypothetical protein
MGHRDLDADVARTRRRDRVRNRRPLDIARPDSSGPSRARPRTVASSRRFRASSAAERLSTRRRAPAGKACSAHGRSPVVNPTARLYIRGEPFGPRRDRHVIEGRPQRDTGAWLRRSGAGFSAHSDSGDGAIRGAALGECLTAARKIDDDSPWSWARAFGELAVGLEEEARDSPAPPSPSSGKARAPRLAGRFARLRPGAEEA